MLNDDFDVNKVSECIYSISSNIPQNANNICDIDIADIKTTKAIHEATNKKYLYCINGHWYNVDLLINCIDILGGGDIKIKQTDNKLCVAIFENSNGTALICPIKKKED